jgi:hypothetical protein
VREKGACQLEWVCKISENVQNFFSPLSAQRFFVLAASSTQKKCAGMRATCIQLPFSNPE